MRPVFFIRLCFIAFFPIALSASSEERLLHWLQLSDARAASDEAFQLEAQSPENPELLKLALSAHAKAQNQKRLFNTYAQLKTLVPFDSEQNLSALEILSWGIIEKCSTSPSPTIRLISVLAATSNQDAKGVKVVQKALQDSHHKIRKMAIEAAVQLQDDCLKTEIKKLAFDEPYFQVKLLALRALGPLRIKESYSKLMKLLTSNESRSEERIAAATSVVQLLNRADRKTLLQLANSNRSGLRELACLVIAHFHDKENFDILYQLALDPASDVRKMAIYLVGTHSLKGQEALFIANEAIKSHDFEVMLFGAWLLTLNAPKEGQKFFKEKIFSSSPERQILLAAALASTGSFGHPTSFEIFQETTNPYVKINLAASMIGERIHTSESAGALFKELQMNKEKWSLDDSFAFFCIRPSDQLHDDLIPNYPEAVNQLTRLELLNRLAIVYPEKTMPAIKQFLKEHNLTVSLGASNLMLSEGDKESIEIVKQLLSDSDPKVSFNSALLLALWGKDKAAINALLKAYPSSDFDKKATILEALGKIGERETLPFLADRLQENSQLLQLIAAAAILATLYH